MSKKVGRNDPCPCGSGKKFKKCCEKSMLGKKFKATCISSPQVAKKTNNLSSLFQKSFTPTQDTKEEGNQPQEKREYKIKENSKKEEEK